MADTTPMPQSEAAAELSSAMGAAVEPVSALPKTPRPPTKHQMLNKLYALPAPLRTFPLPTFVPHNPLSLFHICYVWLSQAINPPASQFDPVYTGWFSPETRSIHVTDLRSVRGLWEQGFYGKGTLSRSEPSWLIREKTRRGELKALASEDVTKQRRVERQQTKWERARKEREAIDQVLLEEAKAIKAIDDVPPLEIASDMSKEQEFIVTELLEEIDYARSAKSSIEASILPSSTTLSSFVVSPVGPIELLALPNSWSELTNLLPISSTAVNGNSLHNLADALGSSQEGIETPDHKKEFLAPVGPMELLALPNSSGDLLSSTALGPDYVEPSLVDVEPHFENGHAVIADATNVSPNSILTKIHLNGSANSHAVTAEVHMNGLAQPKDVPINGSAYPGHDETEVPNGNPASPKIKRRKSVRFSPTVEKTTFIQTEPPSPERAATITTVEDQPLAIQDQEHFQLTMEEAFFLSYSLGALQVLNPITKSAISNEDLFSLFRKSSYYPPISNPGFSLDDPFLISYVVYHHFRSLGWVVRGGVKFAVDYLLYNRGPVFSHAEFAILILPSYSDPYWSSDPFLRSYVKGKEKSWSWMHCINRVITQVKKTLILVYVDIPAPIDGKVEREIGVDGILAKYKVREIVMKRWSSNRMRG